MQVEAQFVPIAIGSALLAVFLPIGNSGTSVKIEIESELRF